MAMSDPVVASTTPHLKILPVYTGAATIDEALRDPRGVRLLWLEVLVNDRLDLGAWRGCVEVEEAYKKACRWYTTYRSVIDALLSRAPLPPEPGPVDPRDYRLFAEAIRFAAAHD